MQYTITIALISILFSSVTQQSVAQLNCPCYDGIGSSKGDAPVFTYSFDNGQSINVCGFVDHEMHDSNEIDKGFVISEFNIFNCESGYSYAQYDATEICRIKISNDSMRIEYLQYLPAGLSWEWELDVIANQFITTDENKLKITDLKPSYQKSNYDDDSVGKLLKTIESGRGMDNNAEIEIGKLKLLALNGNTKAREMLFNYEKLKQERADGAIAQMLSEAIATVKWVESADVNPNLSPETVMNTIFQAAQTGDVEILKRLLPPVDSVTGELPCDGDCIAICNPGNETMKDELRRAYVSISEFSNYFSNAKIVGEPIIEGNEAKVNFLFGPNAERSETMNLQQIDGKWFLRSF